MLTRPTLYLLGTLLTCAACQDSGDNKVDMDSPTIDLAMAPIVPVVTIRDLNTNKVTGGTKVKVDGVIIGPLAYIEINHDKMGCDYNLFVAQPDTKPTLQDGIEVLYTRHETTMGDMAQSIAHCKSVGMNEPVTKLMTGHAVQITGTFTVTPSGDREIVVAAGTDIVDQGQAPMQPMPVISDPKDFVNGTANKMAFQAASGALVQFQNVTVSDINMYQDFMASTDGMNKATLASNFMKRQSATYMAPAMGTVLKSVTGIVFTDFGGTVWPRTAADIVPQ